MSANSRFAVAVHAVVALAYMGGSATSEQLAGQTVNTNAVVLRRILARLVKAGLVEAQPGKTGGFRLALDPGRIDLASVYDAVEDGGLLGIHANAVIETCPVSRGIKPALESIFADAEGAMRKSLEGVRVSELVAKISQPAKKRSAKR